MSMGAPGIIYLLWAWASGLLGCTSVHSFRLQALLSFPDDVFLEAWVVESAGVAETQNKNKRFFADGPSSLQGRPVAIFVEF